MYEVLAIYSDKRSHIEVFRIEHQVARRDVDAGAAAGPDVVAPARRQRDGASAGVDAARDVRRRQVSRGLVDRAIQCRQRDVARGDDRG